MKTMKHKLFKLFNCRVLDGYIGILGFVMHYRILATYGDVTLYIFHLSVRSLFYFSIQSHSLKEYPPITFQLDLFGRTIINTGAKASAEISQSVSDWMQEREEAKQNAAKELEAIDALDLARQYAKEIL